MGSRWVSFFALAALAASGMLVSACGEPDLSREAQEAEGSGDPTGSSGSPLPGIPPALPSGGVPGLG